MNAPSSVCITNYKYVRAFVSINRENKSNFEYHSLTDNWDYDLKTNTKIFIRLMVKVVHICN